MSGILLTGGGNAGRTALGGPSGWTGPIWVELYLASGESAGLSAEVPVAVIDVEADDLFPTIGQFIEAPEVDVTLEADSLVVDAETVYCPPVEIAVTATALLVELEQTFAEFSNVSPEPDAWAYRGPDLVSVDVTSPVPSDPVVAGTITIAVDGVALTVSTVAIAGGFRATAPYRFNDEQSYAVEITAETTSSVGDPEVLSYVFDTAFWTGSTVSAEGIVAGNISGKVGLAGTVMSIASGLACLSGSALSVSPGYVRLDGSVGIALDLTRTGEVVILDGWVTVYISEELLFISFQVGEAASEPVDVGGEAWDPVAAEAGGEIALDVYSIGGHHGIDQALDVVQPVTHLVDVAVQAGEATAAPVDVVIELEGYQATGTVVLDSPSAEWADEEEDEA